MTRTLRFVSFAFVGACAAAALAAPGCQLSVDPGIFAPADDAATDVLPDGAPDAATCEVARCGPPLGMPNFMCWDGSWGGPTGRCVELADGACGWEIRECPPATDCGGIAGLPCPDGLYCKHDPVGACLTPDHLGSCWKKPDACTADWAPVCGCDGTTYGNACAAAFAGTSVASQGACATSCGGPSGQPCGEGEFCSIADGLCASASPVPPAGTCLAKPTSCTKEHAPVCGCDGITYGNRCLAQAAGVNVIQTGSCTKSCGGFAGFRCDAGDFCWYDAGLCRVPDALGTCVTPGGTCPTNWDAVCGCDGKTYGNECAARASATSVWYAGACTSDACGGTSGLRCPNGKFCAFADGVCDATGAIGRCATPPAACSAILAPACGCDGKTYPNPCEAARLRVSIAYTGACK